MHPILSASLSVSFSISLTPATTNPNPTKLYMEGEGDLISRRRHAIMVIFRPMGLFHEPAAVKNQNQNQRMMNKVGN